MASPSRESTRRADSVENGRWSAPWRWLTEFATRGRRLRELDARVSSRVGLVGRGPASRAMREYLGLRWTFDGALRRNVAHCNFCWQEGRERLVGVVESPDLGVVTLTCEDPSHGPGGLRLVRDSGGFRWGEVELDCRPVAKAGPVDPAAGHSGSVRSRQRQGSAAGDAYPPEPFEDPPPSVG